MIKNYYLPAVFLLSTILVVIGFSLFYVHLADIKNLLIIHFESLSGADFLGSKNYVLGILLSGLSINLINFFLSSALYNRHRLFSYLLGIMNILISLLILLVITVIISIN